MATMVKEKRREKKKTKEKSRAKCNATEELNITETLTEQADTFNSTICIEQEISESSQKIVTLPPIERNTKEELLISEIAENKTVAEKSLSFHSSETNPTKSCVSQTSDIVSTACKSIGEDTSNSLNLKLVEGQTVSSTNVTNNYEYLNATLKRIAVPNSLEPISKAREIELSDPNAYLKSSTQLVPEAENIDEQGVQNVVPSAPMLEAEIQPQVPCQQEVIKKAKSKLQCMTIEEAVNMFGGDEMARVKMLSEREEAIVEAGPFSGPENPLVDLLSTFRSSLRALENERSRLTCGFVDEEKSRSSLWKIEKRNINLKKQCKCETSVELRAVYEHAEFLRERLPVARLRLESLLRDVQDSYCHHQHAVLLAYCQIEELISETIQSNKNAMRESLSLILQALRVSDGAASVLSASLRRWAAALVTALVDERDVSQLLFVLHHLFRQSRSVRWAAGAVRARAPDAAAAARTLAVLDTLLAKPRLDPALDCTDEEAAEAWEEVSVRGAGGAVSEGALREIDLLALLHAFPLRDLVSRILLFTHADIREARAYEWGEREAGRGTLRACAGVRALLATLRRASRAHAHYPRLRARLRALAAAPLRALACLRTTHRDPYPEDLEEKIQAELEACFTAGLDLYGTEDLHKLPTTLLTEDAAKDYCLSFIVGLHDSSPAVIESLSVSRPVLCCAARVRTATYAAVNRNEDHELATIVLDFLIQTGARVKSTGCRLGCAAEARACLPRLLSAHTRMRTAALALLPALAQVETLEPSAVDMLDIPSWRPSCDEMQAVLQDWAQRCPLLLQQLLLQLDCTPYTGISLPVQETIGSWLCSRAREVPNNAEYWRALVRLRTHRAWWGGAAPPPPPRDPRPAPAPADAFGNAYALLATSWGHSIPLICTCGVTALCSLSGRPREALHCLAPIMLVMAQSPESVSLTPKFMELVSSIVASAGPSLVDRALRRTPTSGHALLRLLLRQLEGERSMAGSCGRILSAWLHALWRLPAGLGTLDTAALAAREWPTLEAHAALLLQEGHSKEHVTNAVRNASTAPLLCECLLRAYHTHREANTGMFGVVANILWEQRSNGLRIHVDNALQKINANISSEDLVIYRCATAALVAPLHHPSHLILWRLFFHLYLQRPPSNMRETALPVGPLFFSGLMKTRTITQIKKRLQEAATYHHNEAETYKKENSSEPSQRPSQNRVVKSESITIEKGLLPVLTIKDLTGESSDSNDSDADSLSEESEEDSKVEARRADDVTSDVDTRHAFNMACYHTAAERMVREFNVWLEEGDRVRASPHHADIARFIPEQALEAAWTTALSRARPPPCPADEEFPLPSSPAPAPPAPQDSPLDVAVKCIMKIKDRSGTRTGRTIRSPLNDVDVKNPSKLFEAVDKHLKDINTLAKEWTAEVSRISSMDDKLWELVAVLRVPRPLPHVTRHCPNMAHGKCKPVVFYINQHEWCISAGAEQAIKENRSSSRAAVRKLSRPRPLVARTAAALHSIARRIMDAESASRSVERAWRAAGACALPGAGCPAGAALTAFVEEVAERWIRHDANKVEQLLSRWCTESVNSLQQTLCGALLSPRRLHFNNWPQIYTTLLNSKLPPHTIFSYLSKFEMSHWSRSASSKARRDILSSLAGAQTRAPSPILLELLGVHTAAVTTSEEVCFLVMTFATLAADGKLPPGQWTHAIRAAEHVADGVPFDRLGHLLRDLGALWRRARSLYNGALTLVPHAEHIAKLQTLLLRAFVAAAIKLSYQPERVGECAWSALLESWGAWVTPHPATPPLLPSLAEGDEQYSMMLNSFESCLRSVMADCPGTSVTLLQLSFEWSAAAHLACSGGARQEGRVQASELIVALAALPWHRHRWFYGNSLHVASQICATNDREIMTWSCDRWHHTDADTMLCDVTEETIVSRLVTLLYLFTGAQLQHQQPILDEATRLPWWKLPEPALAEALDRFFAVHHNPSQAYHDLPQFQVLLFASELRQPEAVPRPVAAVARLPAVSRDKRARAVSQWTLAAAAPALFAHVARHSHCMLQTLTDLAPHLEGSEGELEELLGRASVIMCMEPAAAAALPVWQKWLSSVSAHVSLAAVSASCALTALPYCAALADAAVQALLRNSECGWSEAVERWRARSPWAAGAEFASRAALHAAYVCARARDARHAASAPLLHALLTADINFVENEAIVAVWICYACRVARACATSATSEAEECGVAARALIASWAQPPRRSILRVVTLQADTNRSTALHRLLCRLAECILSPSPASIEAYETACIAAPGDRRPLLPWGRSAKPALLPRLAVTLYPRDVRYFHLELQEASES